MKTQFVKGCKYCEYCELKRFCKDGVITIEVTHIDAIEIGTLIAKVTARIGPSELFLHELHFEPGPGSHGSQGFVWVGFPEELASLPTELQKQIAEQIIKCDTYMEMLHGGIA